MLTLSGCKEKCNFEGTPETQLDRWLPDGFQNQNVWVQVNRMEGRMSEKEEDRGEEGVIVLCFYAELDSA